MKICETVSIDCDLEKVWRLVVLKTSKRNALEQIRRFVKFQLRQRAEDADGGWIYPFEECIAGDLIVQGLAEER